MIRTNQDYVVFGDNKTISGGTDNYNDNYAKLKKYYYAVMMHGDKKAVYGPSGESWDAYALGKKLEGYYNRFGANRAILLIVCWAGWGVGQELAKSMQRPVVAARSVVSLGSSSSKNYHGFCLTAGEEIDLENMYGKGNSDKHGEFKAEWLFIHPGANGEIIPGGNVLRQDEAVLRAQKYVKK